jgi:hypothetical protein
MVGTACLVTVRNMLKLTRPYYIAACLENVKLDMALVLLPCHEKLGPCQTLCYIMTMQKRINEHYHQCKQNYIFKNICQSKFQNWNFTANTGVINELNRYNSLYWNPGSEAIDAFSQNWQFENNWLVPPVFSVLRVIKHLLFCKARGTL